jgi:hypothetical protein
MMKGHKRAGVTMFAKNHFGSQTRGDASHQHNGLVAPWEDTTQVYRKGYGLYRIQVDLMTHALLGKKNLVYLMDALWSTDYELDAPLKWKMAPFNNDYSSSVFASFDPVAIESVGYDFLRTEYTTARGAGTYVQMVGVEDYLHQAADSLNWPAGISYDPDSTGVHVKSLGVHEHWNNATDMQYTRNLGTGSGIELVKVNTTVDVASHENNQPKEYLLFQNYPNPFNPSTKIGYQIAQSGYVTLKIYDVLGKEVATLVNESKSAGTYEIQFDASRFTTGTYFYRLTTDQMAETKKMLLIK